MRVKERKNSIEDALTQVHFPFPNLPIKRKLRRNVLSGTMLLEKIVENNKIEAYFMTG